MLERIKKGEDLMAADVETLIYELAKSIDNIKSEMKYLKEYIKWNVDKDKVLECYTNDLFSAIDIATKEVEELRDKYHEEKSC